MINIILLISVVCFYAYETADLYELNTYPTYTYHVLSLIPIIHMNSFNSMSLFLLILLKKNAYIYIVPAPMLDLPELLLCLCRPVWREVGGGG